MLQQAAFIPGDFSAFLWDEVGNFYLAEGPCIRYYESSDLSSPKIEKQVDHPIVRMVLTQRHVILFCQGSQVLWLNKYLKEIAH